MSNIELLGQISPASAEAFRALLSAANNHGPLEPKHREFCLLAGFAVTRNESAFRSHCLRAFKSGATPTEVEQTVILLLGTSLGLVPVVEALGWTREVFERASSQSYGAAREKGV